MDSWGSLHSKIVTCGSLLRATLSIASNPLASCAKETFHTVQISMGLLLRLLLTLFLAVVHFLVASLVLKIATVVSEALLGLASPVGLQRLHLTLECVIDALSLIDGVV